MKKIFLDSDVLLDLTLKREDLLLPMLNVFKLIKERELQGMTSSVAFVNIHYFLNKYAKESKFALLFQLRSALTIIKVDEYIIDNALNSGLPDFEDAVQFYAAKSAVAEAIITRNVKDYKQTAIPVYTPEQFLRTL